MYNNHNSRKDNDIGIITKILDCYNRAKNNRDQLELCKYRSIQMLNRQKNKELIKNGLIFVLNLFEEEGAPDLCTDLGIDNSKLSEEKKKELVKVLKKEMLKN